MFVDRAELYVSGGGGGNGCASFRRERHVPRGGPDGGNGGHGGHVIVRATHGIDTLLDIVSRKHWRATRGENGRGSNCRGANGEDMVIAVPPGTVVVDRDRGHVLKDLVDPGDEVVAARGGRGGRGNKTFASATNQNPTEATPGKVGEERWIRLELKLIAEVGLVGLPNAGKSTLLSRLSDAHPAIADYPFTTKTPVLGIVQAGDFRRFAMADIPGLIEGAHAGTGLGHEFLRHVERTRVLVHLVDGMPIDGSDPSANYRTIRRELELYNPRLAEKLELVCVTKLDLTGAADARTRLQDELDKPVLGISAVAGTGLDELLKAITATLDPERLEPPPPPRPVPPHKLPSVEESA